MKHVPLDPDREPDLLVRYREGDPTAFRTLVDTYQDRMLQFFYRLCWDRDRSEDLVQDLFLKLMQGSRRYRPEGKLSTFVYRVATNLWIDAYRAARPRPAVYSLDQVVLPERDQSTDGRAPVEQVADDEEKVVLRRAMESLTEPHRLVFELAVYQERPYAEVAELLGIPVGTVKSRMHNTVLVLKEKLAHLQGDSAGEASPSERTNAPARQRFAGDGPGRDDAAPRGDDRLSGGFSRRVGGA
ncbi:MAG: RNA polymerase sigma factor [Planctomycetes bacterium]|nr:RNA polymerase sigma factor [Planctomycetota bacterium]